MLWFINGSTGSGKTTLLLERAMDFVVGGDRVKIISYEESISSLQQKREKLGHHTTSDTLSIESYKYPTFPQLLQHVLESSNCNDYLLIDGYNFTMAELDILRYLLEQGILRALYVTRHITSKVWVSNLYEEE